MTKSTEYPDKKRMNSGTKMALFVIPPLIIAAVWMTWQALLDSPTRQAGVQLSPYGVVTVSLSTEPYPPVTSGTVLMTLRLDSGGGRRTAIDNITYAYGPVDGSDVFEGQVSSAGVDTYRGPLRFTTVGDWWIKIRVTYQDATDEVEFVLPVKPAI